MAILNENTDTIQSQEKWWQFKPGQSGNSKGRPPGSPNKSTLAAMPLTAADLEKLEDMDKPALIALIKRAAAANWGLFMQTDEQIHRAMMDRLAAFALRNTKKTRVVLKAIDMYLNRTQGKPRRAGQKCW